MPQITVQCSAGLAPEFDRMGFALALHAGASSLIDSARSGFKTRFLDLDTVVGDGEAGDHLLHVIVDIRPGRSDEVKARLATLVLALVEAHLDLADNRTVQASVEIRELADYRHVVLRPNLPEKSERSHESPEPC